MGLLPLVAFFARHSGDCAHWSARTAKLTRRVERRDGASQAGIQFDLEVQGFHSPCGRASYFWHCPKVTKRLGTGRGVLARLVRGKIPCASRRGGVAQTVRPCTASQSRRSIAATLRAYSRHACDARHRERRRDPRIRASLHYLDVSVWKASASALACLSLRLLRQDAAETGPPVARRGCVGKVRKRAHAMYARSLNVHGRTSSEPRSNLADLEGRMPGRRARRGCVSLVTFLCTSQYCPGKLGADPRN
jgi:hypothetical protein